MARVSMKMREALLGLLRGEPTDTVVWTADLTYWLAGCRQRGEPDPTGGTEEGFLRWHHDLGVLPYYYYETFWASEARHPEADACRIERDGHRTVRRFHTPHGVLAEEYAYLPESACGAHTRHFVQSKQDLDALEWLMRRRVLIPANLDDYPRRLALWATYDGVPALGLPRSPWAAFCYEWAGVEAAVYLWADYEDQVRAILDLMERQEAPLVDAVCRLAPPLVHFPDNLASETHTGLYDACLRDVHARRLEQLHAAGVRAAVHLDGGVQGLLPKLAQVGFDAIEALTPQPAGDLTVEAIRATVGNARTILWGGVPGVMFAPPFAWSDLDTQVRRLLAAWRGRPFVVGVADQVPPNGAIEFCRRIAALVREARA